MKAVILAAGKGTRMNGLTAELPKPMLRVASHPVLEQIVRGLAQAGVHEFCIITGYRAEVVEDHFRDGKDFGVSIRYVRQEVASGTASATALAKDFTDNAPFLLTYGDILTAPENYRAMIQLFEYSGASPLARKSPMQQGAAATTPMDGLVSTWRGEDLSKGGAVIIGDNDLVTDIIEKSSAIKIASPLYNAGIYILPPQIFAALAAISKSPRGEYELTDAIKDIIRAGSRLRAFALQGYWLDVRDPEALAKAEKLLTAEAEL